MRWPSPIDALALGAALLLAAACANRAQEAELTPERVAGCYELSLWPDEAGADADAKRASWNVPSFIRLDEAPMTAWPSLINRYGEDVYQALSYIEGRWRDYPINYWRPVGSDSIYAGHPGALAGIGLSAAAADDGFVGVITAHTDVMQMGDTAAAKSSAPIRLSRVDCPGDGG